MTERYVAALDQGTTSTRCLVFDRNGHMVGLAQREHHQYFPQPGWVEHDAEEIWAVTRQVLPEALASAGIDATQVAGIGVTNQRETTVLWDRRTGRPVHRAIVWQDTRTADLVAHLRTEIDSDWMAQRTGSPLVNYFSAPRLRWLLDSDESIRRRAEAGDLCFGTMDTWLVWNLTGGVDGGRHVTDVTNASRTMLMNLGTLQWDPELLEAFDIPKVLLPEIRPSIGTVGTTTDPIAGIAVGGMIGDQQAALFGQGAFDEGDAKCTFGTGSFLLLNTGSRILRSERGLISTVAYSAEGGETVYALEGSNPVAGALVDWCRTTMGLFRTSAEVETVASTVADNGGCYIVPSFSGLFAPQWVGEAQGLVVGLTSFVEKGHLARAVLEATAFQTRDMLLAVNADADTPVVKLNVDGGMTANNLLMQMVSDIADIPVFRPMMAETVALGAAYVAGLGVGYWPDKAVLRKNWQVAGLWEPTIDEGRRSAMCAQWNRAVELAAQWGRG